MITRPNHAIATGWICIAFALLGVRASADVLPQPAPALRNIFDGRAPKTANDLKLMQAHVTQLADHVAKCTVGIQFKSAHGSGVIVSRDGYILTAAHVVGQPDQIVRIRTSDGRTFQARSLGMHREFDAGLLKLVNDGPWDHLQLSTVKRPKKGLWVAAVGNPGGYDDVRGPVFRLGRVLSNGDQIRTDCQLVGGDSGGPLVDMQGRVVGIHSRIGVSLSNNLHVPIATYRANWDELVDGRLWRSRAYIGLRGEKDTTIPRVAIVHPGSPADTSGVQRGDIIKKFNGVTVEDFKELVQLVRQHQPGERVRLSVKRGGQNKDFNIIVGRRP